MEYSNENERTTVGNNVDDYDRYNVEGNRPDTHKNTSV